MPYPCPAIRRAHPCTRRIYAHPRGTRSEPRLSFRSSTAAKHALQPDGLKRDLPLWSSGLFPFFEYASTSVKPVVLGLFECYYIPLQDELRPATRSFILALLPGLEEETSEFFEKVCLFL